MKTNITTKITEIRDTTFNDVIEKLKKFHRCMLIRPTGWGKTWLLVELILRYKKVLYLYPSAVIAETVAKRYFSLCQDTIEDINIISKYSNVTMMTYSKLIRLTPEEFAKMDFDLIIMDEAHRIGANQTSKAVIDLIDTNPNAHIVGATATPNRSDAFDVTRMFFNDITAYPYTVHDAIQDKMLPMPYYCYMTYDIEKDLRTRLRSEPALMAGQDGKTVDELVTEILDNHLIEMADIFGMPKIIQNACDRCLNDTSSMKFIVFFLNKAHMKEKFADVIKWFKEAYPTHTVNTLKISSTNTLEAKNVQKLSELVSEPNTIHLIGCIDMLNMGYHVNDLTGILMYRGTSSNIIYTQQLGRVLSSGSDKKTIVFDVVDNLHRKAVYDLAVKENTTNKPGPKEPIKTPWHLSANNAIVDKYGNPTELIYNANKTITRLNGAETDMFVDQGTKQIFTFGNDNPWWHLNINLGKDDFNHIRITGKLDAKGNEATYEEMIAKLVGEPASQTARTVIYMHLERFCRTRKIPFPLTAQELEKKYHTPISEFYDDFAKLVTTNNIDYPFGNKDTLLQIGIDDHTDLGTFSRIKNISVHTVLKLLRLEPNTPLTAPT